MASRFADVKLGPPIEVFAVNKACVDDPHPDKINMTVGAYRDDEGKPWVLPVVRKTERAMADDCTLNHEYLPVLGLEAFSSAATGMLLGPDHPAVAEGRAFGVQTLSGTGALRVGAEFLTRQLKYSTFYMSNPSWGNHKLVFLNAGFAECREYRYWDAAGRTVDFAGLLEDLRAAPENAVVILHACAHNPTGCDPSREQWEQIADVMKEKKLFPFFDSAYQGFASGDLDKDAWAVRYFAGRGFEFVCAQSFAKNFGLYNERVGNLTMVLNDKQLVPQVKSQVTLIVRGMYSNPPNHGGRIVATVLNNPQLFEEWCVSLSLTLSRSPSLAPSLAPSLPPSLPPSRPLSLANLHSRPLLLSLALSRSLLLSLYFSLSLSLSALCAVRVSHRDTVNLVVYTFQGANRYRPEKFANSLRDRLKYKSLYLSAASAIGSQLT
ncbi:aspartate aminotransferase, cytoplasmic isoform X1 [Bacillus rossius redtenbacheri]|uniref:aspartate aminotransferase, cytoplasmic isoform X1 n=1 Tax=Bacillus rossius redtenbacheri TaxID=93214 RepID=UPI002FDDE5BA